MGAYPSELIRGDLYSYVTYAIQQAHFKTSSFLYIKGRCNYKHQAIEKSSSSSLKGTNLRETYSYFEVLVLGLILRGLIWGANSKNYGMAHSNSQSL